LYKLKPKNFLAPDVPSASGDVIGFPSNWIFLEKIKNLFSKLKNKTLISDEFRIFFD